MTRDTVMSLLQPRTILTRSLLADMIKQIDDDAVMQMLDDNMQLLKLCPGDIINRVKSVPISQKSIYIVSVCVIVIGNPMVLGTDDFCT